EPAPLRPLVTWPTVPHRQFAGFPEPRLPTVPFSAPPSVPLSVPPTAPPTLPSNCACAGSAPSASAEAAASMNLVMSCSFESLGSSTGSWVENDSGSGLHPAGVILSSADTSWVDAAGAADDAAADTAFAWTGFS